MSTMLVVMAHAVRAGDGQLHVVHHFFRPEQDCDRQPQVNLDDVLRFSLPCHSPSSPMAFVGISFVP
jgi:hypothetical protein